MMNTIDEIKKSLIEQHRVIKDDMEKITEMFGSEKTFNADVVYSLLIKFNDDLDKHLQVENHQFYPEIIKQMHGVSDAEKMKNLFHDMMIMEKAVYRLLQKYSSGEKIKSSLQEFKKEFDDIEGVLSSRIELEETKVF
ncbi:MAG: hemerythrin domain-containing protein [Patescibacteria group bacterium]